MEKVSSTPRPLWLERTSGAWRRAPICWLSGVRRVGKTTLCLQVTGAEYLNCDLPEVAARLNQPERFFAGVEAPVVVLDEVHQLDDPARVLKIAADAHPSLRILATGSSTLAATEKFSDSLAGRKRQVHLVPVLPEELEGFGVRDLDWRLLAGGLPPALLAEQHDRGFYSEWLDSYFARDVRELFQVQKRTGFLNLLESLLRQSGGLLETSSMSRVSGLSRPTVATYLDVMETTHVMTRLRPYSGGQNDRELVQMPKAYMFDTGFVCHARGFQDIRPEDRGVLLEHVVLESLQSIEDRPAIHYWRDKARHEVDFVVPISRDEVHAVEVKWDGTAFDPTNLGIFRKLYPKGSNWLVTAQTGPAFERQVGALSITSVSVFDLRREWSARRQSPPSPRGSPTRTPTARRG